MLLTLLMLLICSIWRTIHVKRLAANYVVSHSLDLSISCKPFPWGSGKLWRGYAMVEGYVVFRRGMSWIMTGLFKVLVEEEDGG